MKKELADKLIRCPRLGDEMTFAYCLKESGALPCARIIHCWSLFFDVESFMKAQMPPEKFEQFMNAQPKDKVTSLIELIEKAKAKK